MGEHSVYRKTVKDSVSYLLKKIKRMALVQERNRKLNNFQRNEYIKHLNKRIFWDLNIDKLDCEKSKQEIIERIAVYGDDNDERIMYIMYPLRVIKKCLMKSDSLNEKTVRYFAFVFNKKEEQFKWYSRRDVQMSF